MDSMNQTLNYRSQNDIAPKMQVRQVLQELMFMISKLSRYKYNEPLMDSVKTLISLIQNMIGLPNSNFTYNNIKTIPNEFVEYALSEHRKIIDKMTHEGWWLDTDAYEEI